jgi:hypothetical protein
VVENEVSELQLTQWLLEDFHVSHPIRLQVAVSRFQVFVDDDSPFLSELMIVVLEAAAFLRFDSLSKSIRV